jgi:hypothetical protein
MQNTADSFEGKHTKSIPKTSILLSTEIKAKLNIPNRHKAAFKSPATDFLQPFNLKRG